MTNTSDCAICYVADENFLFATLASALSLRRFVPAEQAEILLFLTGKPQRDLAKLDADLDRLGVRLMPLLDDDVFRLTAERWRQSHISVATLGRLLIGETVAKTHRRMLYVDGDTYFARDPSALLRHRASPGTIWAADDIISYNRFDHGRLGTAARRYLDDLGIPADQRYFNSGIILADVATWRAMAAEALDVYMTRSDHCVNYDQSALNIVAGSRRSPLPIRWNFQTGFADLKLASAVEPAILHFTGSIKAWHGPLQPWQDLFPFYQEVEQRVAHIVARPAWPDQQIAERNAISRRNYRKLHLMFAHRVWRKRRQIIAAERQAARNFGSD
ncbi:glycosyltransferase family 8 protein [Sphingomonas sp.]|uniref:glycosyltransferase family 8 protein n=1 Tax=Sphingomonas sp. TaxID=28214 RepID=UPI003CC606E7